MEKNIQQSQESKAFNPIHGDVNSPNELLEQATKMFNEFRERFLSSIDRDKISSMYKSVESKVKAKPLYYVAGCALAGLCIGLIWKSARRPSIED